MFDSVVMAYFHNYQAIFTEDQLSIYFVLISNENLLCVKGAILVLNCGHTDANRAQEMEVLWKEANI